MRLVFMGTPSFALPSLKLLLASDHQLLAVITRPDRPQGRGLREAPPPVKIFALENGLPLFQPQRLRDESFLKALAKLQADLFVVVAFRILPTEIYTMPPKGTIDLHPSLLPKYRGAAPINWAIINGEQETGVSVFFIGEEVDAGDMILQKSVLIGPQETAGQLSEKLAEIGAQTLLEAINALASERRFASVDMGGEPSSAPKITREDGRIDWSKPAIQIKNLIRGLNPKPGAFATYKGKMLKIHRAGVIGDSPVGAKFGQVVAADPREGIFVNAGGEVLHLEEVQLEGKKRISSAEFLRGFPLKEGDLLI